MRIFILFLLLLTNCGRAEYSWPAYVKFSPSTAPEYVFMASKSLRDLNVFLGTDMVVFSLDAQNVLAYPVTVKFSASPSENGYAGVAVLYNDFCEITIYPIAIQNNIFKTVMWHEISHCAGLMHVEEKGHIMSPQIGSFSGYSEEKLEFFKNQLKPILRQKAR